MYSIVIIKLMKVALEEIVDGGNRPTQAGLPAKSWSKSSRYFKSEISKKRKEEMMDYIMVSVGG